MKALGGTLSAVGVGAGITVAGWPMVVALGTVAALIVGLICWVLASPVRTTRLTAIIRALRDSGGPSAR